jgi:hypothetical protein
LTRWEIAKGKKKGKNITIERLQYRKGGEADKANRNGEFTKILNIHEASGRFD